MGHHRDYRTSSEGCGIAAESPEKRSEHAAGFHTATIVPTSQEQSSQSDTGKVVTPSIEPNFIPMRAKRLANVVRENHNLKLDRRFAWHDVELANPKD